MRIHLAVALVFLLSACADDRSITAPPAPSQAAKALALPTASLSPDPATVAFAADSTWHAFAIETTADSLLFEVNPETTDVVLAVAGPDRPEAGGCPAEPTDRIAWTEPSGDSLYVAACGPGHSQVVIRELVYELALTRYQVAVEPAADTLQTPAEEAPFGTFFGLLGTEMVVTPREETEPTQEEETPTEEPEQPEEPEEQPESDGDTDDEPDQKEPDGEEPTEPEQIDYDGVSSDQEALVALYDATGGFIFWENTTNWNSKVPLDQWYGVDTDGSGRVIRLDLSDNNSLLGEIPPSIGQLKKLEVLDLSGNLLIGVLPKELGQLESLEVLKLDNNLMEGAIPAELGQLENLRVLNLSVNLFSGRIPTELENLRNLETFRIGGYGLSEYTGCLPSHFRTIPDNDIGTLWVDVPFCSGGAGKLVASDPGPSRSERATMLRIKQERFAQVRTQRQ